MAMAVGSVRGALLMEGVGLVGLEAGLMSRGGRDGSPQVFVQERRNRQDWYTFRIGNIEEKEVVSKSSAEKSTAPGNRSLDIRSDCEGSAGRIAHLKLGARNTGQSMQGLTRVTWMP